MRRVVVVCEGQTEEAFISRVLYPAFVGLGLHLHGITVETSPGHKGGAMRYDRLRPALRNALANGRVVAVTMLVDLYKLAPDFPGYATAMAQSDLAAKLAALQSALHADLVAHCRCDPARFIPHVQPHEFEALLFSDVETLAAVENSWSAALADLNRARNAVPTPEHINDGPATKPSARLELLLRSPGYRKLRHGPIAAERMGLAKIEAQCPHFAAWLQKLRAL
jgi:hypothetical protein